MYSKSFNLEINKKISPFKKNIKVDSDKSISIRSFIISAISQNISKNIMRVKLEPDTAFIGKKFAYLFLGVIFGLNAITFFWFFFFSKLI